MEATEKECRYCGKHFITRISTQYACSNKECKYKSRREWVKNHPDKVKENRRIERQTGKYKMRVKAKHLALESLKRLHPEEYKKIYHALLIKGTI